MKMPFVTAVFISILITSMAIDNTSSSKDEPTTGLEQFYLDEGTQAKLEGEAQAGNAQSALRLALFYRFIKKNLDFEQTWLERAYAIDHNPKTKVELSVSLIHRARRDLARARILLQEASREGEKSADSWLKETF